MISPMLFEQEFKKMVVLCGFTVKMEAIDMYYEKLKFHSEQDILNGIKLIINDPPAKLTLSRLKSFINQVKPEQGISDWTGAACTDERCNRGLISENINGNSTLFRCTKCNSSKLMFIADHTQENVYNETNKEE